MKNLKGYSVEKIGNLFYVVYEFDSKEKMMMSKGYSTVSGANKRFDNVVYQAGIKQ